MPDPALYPKLRADTENLFNLIQSFDEELSKEAQSGIPGYADYGAAGVGSHLERASRLLAKQHYTMCVAGTFSSGKSTFINGLLEESELLPAAAGECTLSITVVQAPGPGENERVAVDYFTKEVAVNSIIEHQQKFRNAFKYWEKDLLGAGVEQQIDIIKQVVSWLPTVQDDDSLPKALREEYTSGKCEDEFIPMLKGFLHYLEQHSDRMGRTYIDNDVDSAGKYLASDGPQKFFDIGHLLLIEKVTVFKNNRLFVEKGLQIVDTPGTDSANPRQRDITHQYLNNADVVVSVLEPRGFTMANMDIIAEMARANMGNIRNKMFFVINKFDMLSPDEFEGNRIGIYLNNEFKAKVLQEQLSAKHIYPTVALVDVLRAKNDSKQEASVLASCKDKLDLVGADTEEPWKTRVTDALSGNGVVKMRETLINYLERELAFERLRDVQRALDIPMQAAAQLISANGDLINQARSGRTSAVGQIRDFVTKAQTAFESNLLQLAQGLPTIIKERVIAGVIKPKVNEMVERFKGVKLTDLDVQRSLTGRTAQMQTPAEIKQLWIDFVKQKFCDDFVDLIRENLVGPVQGLVDQQITASNVDKILEYISPDDQNLAQPLRDAIERSKQNIDVLTRMRADEETWVIRDRDIRPQGFEPAWTEQIETSFKQDIVGQFTAGLSAFADKLAVALPKYYGVVARNLIAEFKAGADEMERALLNKPDIDLPIHLLTGEAPDPREKLKRRLLLFADLLDKAREASGSLTGTLGGD